MITILAKKDVVDEKYLRMCDPEEVKTVMQYTADQRVYHRASRNGYSPNKNMRELSAIPESVYWNPAFRHIFHNPDAREGQKLKRRFLRTFSKFMTVDKM